MGREVTAKAPNSTPNWTAIKTALKATASTAGKKRCRPCQRIFSEYNLHMTDNTAPFSCYNSRLNGDRRQNRRLHPPIMPCLGQIRRVPCWQFAQPAAAIGMVPKLRCDHAHQAHVHSEALQRRHRLAQLELPRPFYRLGIEKAGRFQRFGAEQLIDPARPRGGDEGPSQMGAEHGLGPLGNGGGSTRAATRRSRYLSVQRRSL